MRIDLTDAAAGDWRPAALPLQQSHAYGEVLAGFGAGVARVELRCPSGARARAQVVRRRFGPLRLALLSRGPVWDGAPEPEEEAAALRTLGRHFRPLIATPEPAVRNGPGARPGPEPLRAGLPLVAPRHRALLDLSAEPPALRARLAAKWRNRLVRGEAAGLDLRLGRPDPATVAWLLSADDVQQRRRGYRALPARFTLAWLARDPGAALLAEARLRGGRVAAMLFLLHAPWASYHVGWTGTAGRQVDAHRLLLWHAMLALKAAGFGTLDLGDVNIEDAPGLARFKTGTGAGVARLGATVLLRPW